MSERASTKGRLGSRQIKRLTALAAVGMAYVVGDKELRRLADLGLVRPAGPDSFYHLTPSGLRMIARLADDGRIDLAPKLPRKERADATPDPLSEGRERS